MRGHLLFILYLICSVNVIAQQEFTIQPKDIDIERKKINVEITKIKIEQKGQHIGKVKLKDNNETIVKLSEACESEALTFLQKQFQQKSKAMDVSLRISDLRIQGKKIGIPSPNDTFFFRCELYKGDISPDNFLYTFKAKNQIGEFANMSEILNNYYSRALLSAVDKFNISLDSHPEWFITEEKNEKPIKTTIIYNALNGRDSIACKKSYYLKISDYTVNSKDTSKKNIFTKITFTYKISAQENSKELNLKVYPMAFFDKNRSWAKPNLSGEGELNYQQGHYDLGTIYGEKFASELKATNFSLGGYKSEINAIYNKHFAEYAKQRKDYIKDTQDGSNSQQVNLWRKKINSMLSEVK